MTIAAPWILTGSGDDSSSDGIEFDITAARQEIRIRFDWAGMKTSVPDRSTTPLEEIDAASVPAREPFHKQTETIGSIYRIDDEMDMVRHQAECIHFAGKFGFQLAQQFKIELIVGPLNEYRRPIVAPLNNVMGIIRQHDARRSRHWQTLRKQERGSS
jgi:hypothetical protein